MSSDVDMTADTDAQDVSLPKRATSTKLSLAFFSFGLINNALYVVILSAAQDILQREAPIGVVLLANIFPALIAKVGWPYLMRGQVRYAKRVVACTIISVSAMLLVALVPSTPIRLFGIAWASFSSGLGELTYLQLSTQYGSFGSQAVGWFSSGTGAAGFVGALWWWLLRGLGIPIGLGLSSLLPLGMSIAYFLILPTPADLGVSKEDYSSVANGEAEEPLLAKPKVAPLTTAEKLDLAKPLVVPYMLPLFAVYAAEYTINTGVAPTLLFPVPPSWPQTIRGLLIHQLSDHYVLYQLVYQIFVFFARSSTVICRLPPLPKRMIPLPSILQCGLLILTIIESTTAFIEHLFGSGAAFWLVLLMIALEGCFGGLAYISVFTRLNIDQPEPRKREFEIASVGFADTSGIVFASLVSTILQPALCNVQVSQGRTLCRDL